MQIKDKQKFTMEITGTIIQVLPRQEGISKAGNQWKKQEYILENTDGQYPRKVCFTCFGDNADRIQLTAGQRVKVSFDLESREYNGRWYTEVRCWRAEPEQAAAPAQPVAPQAPVSGSPVPPPPVVSASSDDDFPF